MVSTGSGSPPLNFIVRAFDYQNLNSPLISLFPLDMVVIYYHSFPHFSTPI